MLRRILLLLSTVWLATAADVNTLHRGFQNPPRDKSLMPYWFWNGTLSAAETRRQMEEMIRQGVHQAVVFPWDGMDVRYLSEDYWRQVGAALDTARQLGFTLNFADEYDWPSAHAWDRHTGKPELSQVLLKHPEFRMRRLATAEFNLEGPNGWSWECPETPEAVVAARLDAQGRLEESWFVVVPAKGRSLRWEVPPGRWLLGVYWTEPAVGAHNTRLDMLNADAVKTYLDMVYEEYARRFPQHMGTTIKLTVADHEGAYGEPIAWTPKLWQEFQKRQGFDLRPWLPLLAHDTPDGARSRRIRTAYLETVSAMYAENFSEQVTAWCTRHGIKHGTSTYEEQMLIQVDRAGDMFRQWRAGTGVFIDALLERSRLPIDFKEAVSVAHFDGKPLWVENQGLQGNESYFSLEKARLGTNMCLLWGADALLPYFDYNPKAIQWPPQWFLGQPTWRYFHHYADLARRGHYMNAQGTHIAPVLVYYPRETAFANSAALFGSNRPGLHWNGLMDRVQDFYSALQLELTRNGWDYHIADSYYMDRAEIRDGAIHIAGESFRALVLPPMTDMDPAAARKIRKFIAAGGSVLAAGELPRQLAPAGIRLFPTREHPLFMDRLNYTQYIETPAGIREDLKPLLDALRGVEPPQVEILGGGVERLYFSHRRAESVDWYWAVNDTDRDRRVKVRMPGAGTFEMWDAETGQRRTLRARALGAKSELELSFGPHDAYFVVRHAGPATAPPASIPAADELVAALPPTGWRLTLESPTVEVPYAQIEGSPEPLWLAPERLSNPDWWLIGPFPYDDHKGFYREFAPEREFRPEAKYPGAFTQVSWQWISSPTYSVTVRDALKLPGNRTLGVYYAFAYVWSPQARRAQLLASFADGMKAWWNGQLVLSDHRHQKWSLMRDCWAERRPIQIQPGWNRVLLKIEPSLSVPTAFMFRLVGEDGATLRDVVYSRDEQLVPRAPKRVRLHVAAPPGTGERDRAMEMDWDEIPERPVAFSTRTTPFELAPWSDSTLANYSGSALYETEFELPSAATGKRLWLDLGAVGLAAEVWVNGEKAGERAWRPFRFDITREAKAGKNALRVRVANSNAGWLAQGDTVYQKGSWGLHYRTERDRIPFMRPNGLEGPVRVVAQPR
jgi:hypothetical protein